MVHLARTAGDVRRDPQQQPPPLAGRDGRDRAGPDRLARYTRPPTPWLESAIQAGRAVPGHVRRRQRPHGAAPGAQSSTRSRSSTMASTSTVGPRAPAAVRRLVRAPGPLQKGAASRDRGPPRAAGLELDLVGPVADRGLLRPRTSSPQLGPRHPAISATSHHELVGLLGELPPVTLVTPRWDEPYGLVGRRVARLSTPVAAFTCGSAGGDPAPDHCVLLGTERRRPKLADRRCGPARSRATPARLHVPSAPAPWSG